MKVKYFVQSILVLFLAGGVALAEPQPQPAQEGKTLAVRSFQLKYKEADKAAAAIKPLMSADGQVSMQPSTSSLTITDRPENLKEIARALALFDTPAQTFRLHVQLVAASRVQGAAPRVTDSLREVATKLAMLRFNSFENLGEIDVEGKEGDPGLVDLPSGYRADFRFGEFENDSDSIKVTDFRLSKVGGAQRDVLNQLLKTSLNLKLGQTVIIGASKVPQSQKALMIVLLARR